MNSYEEAKKYLAEIWIDVSKITRETSDYIFAALDDANIDIDQIKCFAAPQTPPEIVLDVLWLDKEYFIWKKILDLWWGYGGMPFLLEDVVEKYIVCDPCFEDIIKENSLNRAFMTQKTIMSFDQNTSIFFKKKQKVLDYLKMWENFDIQQHPRIVINSSKWEDIQWVEDHSQDVVLICHILDKYYINYAWILAEASRILKPDWEVLIVEDADDEMRKILTKLWLEREEKYSKIVCKIKKTS